MLGEFSNDPMHCEDLNARTCSASPLSTDEPSPDADVDIPSAQPRPDRHVDVVDPTPAPEQCPPNDDDDESSDPLETSADLLLPNEDLVKLNDFRAKWFESFSAEHSWEEFCRLCEQFANETRDMSQYLNRPKNPTSSSKRDPPSTVPPRPPRRPPHDRGFRRFDPVEARRIQGLYRHSKKRAARKLLNDVSVSYSGSKLDAENYFETVFDEKTL